MYEFLVVCGGYEQRVKFFAESLTDETITVNADLLRQTTCELLGISRAIGETAVEPLGRGARIETVRSIDMLVLDDAGEGEYTHAMGPCEAAELIRAGLVRDTR